MNATFELIIMELKSVHNIPELWTDLIYRQILQDAEFDDIHEIDLSELPDYTVMALQDLKPENAAEVVLGSLTSGLSKGVRQNLAYDLKEQPMWEAFDTLAYHQPIFTAAVLLNRAFPKVYPRPEIARLILKLTAVNKPACKLLDHPSPLLVARLLAEGMEAHSTLRRLYSNQLENGRFPDAPSIIWETQVRSHTLETADWVIYAPWYWLRPLQSIRAYTATVAPE